MKERPYQSARWLKLQYETYKLSEEQIAKKANCSAMTIHTYLIKFGLYNKR